VTSNTPDGIPWPDGTLLSRLPAPTRTRMLRLGTPRTYPPGHTLLKQGDRGGYLYLLIDGVVKVIARVENGTESLLGIRVGGDLVGELAVLSGDARSASVITCGAVVASVITTATFERFVAEQPTVGFTLSRMIGDRLRWANDRRLDSAAYEVDVRLARVLLHVASRHGRRSAGGVEIGVPLTQAELGALIGAREVTVQRALRTLETRDLVSRGRRKVLILDLDGLTKFADL
jgi:CRP/FNR family transcriptional regulator, cyclic AMP receptor protein